MGKLGIKLIIALNKKNYFNYQLQNIKEIKIKKKIICNKIMNLIKKKNKKLACKGKKLK